VHAVYSDIRISHSSFIRSLSDALDLDISKAVLENNRFQDSGNDAIDLMTTDAVVINTIIDNSGDKAVSVGEGSRLLAINSRFSNNEIAVQSKDGSVAALYNMDLLGSNLALNAYKKNWRYSSGGELYIYKSRIFDNNDMITSDKKSRIHVTDSSYDNEIVTKKKNPRIIVDNMSSTGDRRSARDPKLIRKPSEIAQLKDFDPLWWNQVKPEARGSSGLINEN